MRLGAARLALALVVLPLGAGIDAQEKPPTFTEKVEVRVMDLDVVVTDKEGRPVPDLKREDFTIFLAGKPVAVDYFARVDEGTIHAPDLATASPDQVLAAYRQGDQAYVPRHFLMYVDVGHLAPDGRKRGLETLRDLVTRMGPNDRGRIVLFDRRSHELAEWTSSKETLFAALAKIEEEGARTPRLDSERQTLVTIDTVMGRNAREQAIHREATARRYAEEQSVEVRQLLSDVGSELTTLAPLAGKKAFLFVSGGFDFRPGHIMASYATGQPNVLSFTVRDVSGELDAIARRANASEITFYTVDARGLDPAGGASASDNPLLARSGVSFLARQDSQEGMTVLARETGGIALLNSNDFATGVARIYQDASVYYSIGVTLSKVPAPGQQAVRVDVNRPGVNVRTRRGYTALTEADRARDRVQAALRTNYASTDIPLTLKTEPATRSGKVYQFAISVTFPAAGLTFETAGGSRRASADISIAAMDDTGRMSEPSRAETMFTLPEGANEGNSALQYKTMLQTRKGNHRIVVNVRDRASGRTGIARTDVRVE
ncbi:MAG TPA: VWA domain-containing protein [Thermoanaerobaculia bacterium]|nr:VWA domain-containing protein [Thermoanaerobaculia bacterium]